MKKIALFRGINVGGNKKVPMAELCKLAANAGFTEIQTYINSGNLIFEAEKFKPQQIEVLLESAIKKKFGFQVDVIVRTAAQWSKYVAGSPFADRAKSDPKFVHLGLSKLACKNDLAKLLSEKATFGEKVKVVGDGIWIDFPKGVGKSKWTPALIDKAAGSSVTLRNWNTVLKIEEMLRGEGE